MKKGLFCALVCMLMILTTVIPISANSVSKPTFQSQMNGNTLYVGGSGPGNYTKIQNAINNASDGDTVFVYDDSSPYIENVVVHTSISLIGEDKQTTVIFGVGNNNASVYVQSEEVTVRGFTLTHSYEGIRVESNNCSIENNIITHNKEGIDVFLTDNILIKGNVISNNSQGLYIISFKGAIISGNIISGNTNHGINLGTENALITLNTISDNGLDGIMIGRDNNIIRQNNIINNGGFGVHIWNSKNNSILQNNIYNNRRGNARVSVDLWIVMLRSPFNHTWEGNYWGQPHQYPKVILGCKYLFVPTIFLRWFINTVILKSQWDTIPFGIFIPIIKFDRHPSQEPYDIPGIR